MFRFSWIARGGRWKCFCFHSWNETAKSATLFPNFPPISPPNAGKYRHFRPRLHRAVLFCQLRGFEVGVLRIPTILCCFGTFYDFIHPQATPPRENQVCEMRIRDLRAKLKKRDSAPHCFVSRNTKRPGKYAGLFQETKRRRKSCFVSVVSLPTCFNSGPTIYNPAHAYELWANCNEMRRCLSLLIEQAVQVEVKCTRIHES